MPTAKLSSNRHATVPPHQYIERRSNTVRTEKLIGDRTVRWLYSRQREHPDLLLRALSSPRFSRLLGNLRYDVYLGNQQTCGPAMLRSLGARLDECLDDPVTLNTPRKVFERRIRYWETRPMPEEEDFIVAPADARMLPVSLPGEVSLMIKEKFFTLNELLGVRDRPWLERFSRGQGAVFRLTPDRYHYTHTPVAGTVVDYYAIEGACHSCNPAALVHMAGLHARNRRHVTIINTDVPGGSGAGLVAMIEIVALMIGDIVQCYSEERYDQPAPLREGLFLRKGVPKSLFRPGSSSVVLLFEPARIAFDSDLLANSSRQDAHSRFSVGLDGARVETDVEVRSRIARSCLPAVEFLPHKPCRLNSSSLA